MTQLRCGENYLWSAYTDSISNYLQYSINKYIYTYFADNSNNIVVEKQAYGSSSTLLAGAPSFGGGASFDTLDFSLPSYSEANGGAAEKSEAPKSAPGFSAGFPELKLPGSGDSQSSAPVPAVDEAEKKAADEVSKKAAEEDKAAAKKAAEEDKAAKAKAKEDARIAKDKEAAEKEAAAEKKKAELAVRREAEKQKQE